jgi:hypothetical protein
MKEQLLQQIEESRAETKRELDGKKMIELMSAQWIACRLNQD